MAAIERNVYIVSLFACCRQAHDPNAMSGMHRAGQRHNWEVSNKLAQSITNEAEAEEEKQIPVQVIQEDIDEEE